MGGDKNPENRRMAISSHRPLRATPSLETVRPRRVIAKESNLSPIGGRRGNNSLRHPQKTTKNVGFGPGSQIKGQGPKNEGPMARGHIKDPGPMGKKKGRGSMGFGECVV